MTVFLGIEGGGTKTKSHLMSADGTSLNDVEGGPTNYQAVGFETAFSNLKLIVQNCLQTISGQDVHAFLAIAGVDTPKDVLSWQKNLLADDYFSDKKLFTKITVGNDIQAALRCASENKNAIALISGTGSACYGRNDKGEEAKSSGLKQILADQGSGYELGLQALKQITKELDGRAPRGVLTQLFFDKYQINSLEELNDLVYGHGKETSESDKRTSEDDKGGVWDKSKIGEIALLVHEAADKQDPWALWICEQAVGELVQMVTAVVTRLSLFDDTFDLVLIGSIINKFNQIATPFRSRTQELYPKVVFQEQKMEPARAAAFLAKEAMSS